MTKQNNSIRRLILAAFLFLAMIGVASSLWGIKLLYDHEARLDRLKKASVPTLIAAYEISRQGEGITKSASNLIRSPNKWTREAFVNRISDQFNWIDTQLGIITELGYDKAKIEQIRKNKQDLQISFSDLTQAIEDSHKAKAASATKGGLKKTSENIDIERILKRHNYYADLMTYSVANLTKSISSEIEELISQSQKAVERQAWTLALYTIIGALVALLLMVRLDARVGRRLKAIQVAMRKVAGGDKKALVPLGGHDEISDMEDALGIFIKEMTGREERSQELTIKAEKANKAKSAFLAAASHDLRQPLQAISLFSSALQNSIMSGGDQAHQKNLDMVGHIRTSVDALGRLLNTILNISKLETGGIDTSISVFPVDDCLQAAVMNFKHQTQEKGLDIRFVPGSSFVRSDPVLLKQIIDNFIGNALNYTKKGRILIGCRHVQGDIRIEVWDTGIGIPTQKLEKIFDEFYQLENPARQRDQGFGLGLAIVKRTALLLGHPVHVRSTVGRGSVFSIVVPRGRMDVKNVTTKAQHHPSALAGGNRKILIVDDDPLVLSATVSIMEGWGYNTTGVPSSRHALDIISDNTLVPELLILDYQLPGNLTGLDLYYAIKIQANTHIPGIIISGDTNPTHLEKFNESGLAHMTKPIDPDLLKKKIQTVLS